MKEITAKQRNSYLLVRSLPPDTAPPDCAAKILADALRGKTAELMESEFKREHGTFRPALPMDGVYPLLCQMCGSNSCWDPRHLFKFPQWQQAAEKLLKGEE